jgi:hypothetical protein
VHSLDYFKHCLGHNRLLMPSPDEDEFAAVISQKGVVIDLPERHRDRRDGGRNQWNFGRLRGDVDDAREQCCSNEGRLDFVEDQRQLREALPLDRLIVCFERIEQNGKDAVIVEFGVCFFDDEGDRLQKRDEDLRGIGDIDQKRYFIEDFRREIAAGELPRNRENGAQKDGREPDLAVAFLEQYWQYLCLNHER